jgi:integrase
MVRKSEFILAKWEKIDFNAALWTIPKDRMKAGRAHNVDWRQQALDILVAFKTCFDASSFLHPGRYETERSISAATRNRVIDAAVKILRESGRRTSNHSRYMICVEPPVRDCTKRGSTATG